MKLAWKKERGSAIQAPISHGGSKHHYVISHRPEDHTVSFRPPGEHHHVGSYRTEREAKAAAEQHVQRGVAPPSNTKWSVAAWGPKGPPAEWQGGQGKGRDHATKKKKSPGQLDREIAEALGSPQHATRKSPAAEKKRQLQELQQHREQLLQAMGYAGNTQEQVRRYHDMIDEIDAKMRLVK